MRAGVPAVPWSPDQRRGVTLPRIPGLTSLRSSNFVSGRGRSIGDLEAPNTIHAFYDLRLGIDDRLT